MSKKNYRYHNTTEHFKICKHHKRNLKTYLSARLGKLWPSPASMLAMGRERGLLVPVPDPPFEVSSKTMVYASTYIIMSVKCSGATFCTNKAT